MDTFQEILTQKVEAALAAANLPQVGSVTPSTEAHFGDYQSNAALILAKQLGKNPRDLAQQIVDRLDEIECETPTIAGPGFINFRPRTQTIAEHTARLLSDERLGVPPTATAKRIVIDFGSPNVAKPMHVGHIRSTVLGDALARIAAYLGHEVVRDNHIGDWGTQFGLIILAWKKPLYRKIQERLPKDPMRVLQQLYKLAFAGAKVEPLTGKDTDAAKRRHARRAAAREKAREELVKLQQGDPKNYAIWQQCVEYSRAEFQHVYDLLDVHYDIQRGESFYNDRLAAIVDRLLKEKIAEESEGAIVVFFPDIPELADKPCIIRKRDGGYNYATTDIATVDYRVDDLGRDTCWYVVGAPQTLHFKQIFEIARREGRTADFRHIPFGSILGEDRKLMKTRSGENVALRDVLDEAVVRARKIVDEKNPDLPEAERDQVARIIGIGAVKYADLSQYRMTDYIFSWDRMLSFQGNTAPYLQNAYVRIRSIFRKAGEEFRAPENIALEAPEERTLALKLCQFAEIVPAVLNDFRPNLLANYLYELANAFHAFYEACPVLKSEEPARSSRLALCELSGRVLAKGLDLLGIKVPERM
jgi:arginyl-tRNA synthetase